MKQPGEVRLTYEETRLAYNSLIGARNMPPETIDLLGKLYRAILIRAAPEERKELGKQINARIRVGKSCPDCGRELARCGDRDAFRCPRCAGEWWPDDSDDKATARDCWNDEQRLKKQMIIKSGSGGRRGRKRRNPATRQRLGAPTTEELTD